MCNTKINFQNNNKFFITFFLVRDRNRRTESVRADDAVDLLGLIVPTQQRPIPDIIPRLPAKCKCCASTNALAQRPLPRLDWVNVERVDRRVDTVFAVDLPRVAEVVIVTIRSDAVAKSVHRSNQQG